MKCRFQGPAPCKRSVPLGPLTLGWPIPSCLRWRQRALDSPRTRSTHQQSEGCLNLPAPTRSCRECPSLPSALFCLAFTLLTACWARDSCYRQESKCWVRTRPRPTSPNPVFLTDGHNVFFFLVLILCALHDARRRSGWKALSAE